MNIIALFNNKGGVGKTTVAYHLTHMLPRIGCSTLAVDLDPQANLTSAFLDEDELESLWVENQMNKTVFHAIEPVREGLGDISEPETIFVADGLHLLAGDLRLSLFEDKLSELWPNCFAGRNEAFRATTAFFRTITRCAEKTGAQLAIVDVGPNLGAINRAALLCADYLVFPLCADMFSLQGLRNLGPTVAEWRKHWERILNINPNPGVSPVPSGVMKPLGYVVLQHGARLDKPTKAYDRWLKKIPEEYRRSVLERSKDPSLLPVEEPDPCCLGTLRHYRSLMPMAQQARRPVFDLKPADGAFGDHQRLVRIAYDEFRDLARTIVQSIHQQPPNQADVPFDNLTG